MSLEELSMEKMSLEELKEKKASYQKEFEKFHEEIIKYPLHKKQTREYKNLATHAEITGLKILNYQSEIQKRNLEKGISELKKYLRELE